MFVSAEPDVTVVATTGSSVSPPVPNDEFAYALLWIVFPGGVKGAVAGIEVVVSVQHQVGRSRRAVAKRPQRSGPRVRRCRW
jgi:hypothetical protein